MKIRTLVFNAIIISTLLSTASSQAQTRPQIGDWSFVQQLAPDSRISVKAQRRITCVLESVDDQTLTCRIETPRYFNYSPEVFFDRRDVREVRLEHSDDFHAYVGTGIGFVTGAAIGAAKTSASPGVAALIYGTVGGLIGHELGPIVAVIHGQVIYRR